MTYDRYGGPKSRRLRFGLVTPYLVAALLVAGCATTPARVDVVIPIACDPPTIAEPAKPIDAITPTADVFEVTRALWATVEILEGTAEQLRAAVEACRGVAH